MPSKFQGHFFFKRSDNGNLFGEYTNEEMDEIGTESAVRSDPEKTGKAFEGTYRTCWLEGDAPTGARLSITPIEDAAGKYGLEWYGKNDKKVFSGQGILCDGMLIGHYKNS